MISPRPRGSRARGPSGKSARTTRRSSCVKRGSCAARMKMRMMKASRIACSRSSSRRMSSGILPPSSPMSSSMRMQLDRVEPQVMREPVDGAGAIILQQPRRERLERRFEAAARGPRRRATPRSPHRTAMALAPTALRLDSCLARAIISISSCRRGERFASSTKRSRSEPTAAPRPDDDVGDVAELLQDRVVGDRAHAGWIAALGRVIALALHRARSGPEQEVCPERAEQGPVARMREEVLLVGAQAQLEIERAGCCRCRTGPRPRPDRGRS